MRFFDLLARDALAYMFEGSMESGFFLGEIIIGAILPMALFLTRRVRETTGGLFLASVLVLFGFIANRLNVAVTGMAGSAGYIPSWQEIVITASIVALGLVIFRMVAKHTPVFETPVSEPSGAKSPLVAAGRSGKLAMGVLFALLIFIMTGLGYTLANKRVEDKQIVESPKLIPAESGLEFSEPIVFQPSEDSPGKVTFNHETHVDPYEPGCGNCHAELFAIRPEQAGVTITKGEGEMILHEKCGSCHDGENAFSIDDGCEFCHQLPE
jgi:c(7)-type cytochrome triheme protein